MQRLTIAELGEEADAFDAAVARTAGIDLFCSSSAWILPAHRALHAPRDEWLWRVPAGYLALARAEHPEGFASLEPLEAAWGLACPLVGSDPTALAEALAAALSGAEAHWDVALLSGIPPGSPLFRALAGRLSAHYRLRTGPKAGRIVASLEGGLDGYLARRSHTFRRNARRAAVRAGAAGVELESCRPTDPDRAGELYARLLDVDRRSWKGRAQSGLSTPEMRAFYGDMIERLARRGAARILFARQTGRDVAYMLGGVFGATYRGLQFGFDEELRPLGLGALCQLRQVEELCREGYELYDLGTEMDYKRRWGEISHQTVALVAQR